MYGTNSLSGARVTNRTPLLDRAEANNALEGTIS